MRISRAQAFMETAWVWSKRSTCFRLNVGAVVVVDGRIVSHGYNGQASGEPHCAGNDCPGVVPGRCNVIHAEDNALMRVPFSLTKERKQLYVTHAPCQRCAEIIHLSFVDKVFYAIPYRLTDGIDYLINAGIQVYIVTPAGYVVDHHTNQVIEMP